jgi:hypothetical protein
MKVSEYRDLANHAFSMARDLNSCTTDEERRRWGVRAEKLKLELWAASKPSRATQRDCERMEIAKTRLRDAFDSVSHLVFEDKQFLGL